MKNFLKGHKIKGRYFLVGGLFLVALFLAIPQDALAVPWYLTPSGLFSAFISGILKVLLKLAGVFLEWMTQAVGWAVGNPFNISYTRPGLTPPDNFIIEIGWTLLRDLVNMGFILGLAFIGLSTALDFGNKFATTKTFFNLILIALLVNFTPAICGAVVDMGNILGSFFTQGVDFSTLNGIFNSQQGKIDKVWTNIITEGTVLLNAVSLIAFGFISALILCVYFVLFAARGPLIWLLVILSPVAFFAFIFDQTRKEFSKWWDKFIQWALIMPVTLGFFLYLSQQILVRVNEIMNASGSSPSGFINQIMPYTLPVATLALGLFLGTTSLMPKGGAAVMALAKTAGGAAIGAAGAGVASVTKQRGSLPAPSTPPPSSSPSGGGTPSLPSPPSSSSQGRPASNRAYTRPLPTPPPSPSTPSTQPAPPASPAPSTPSPSTPPPQKSAAGAFTRGAAGYLAGGAMQKMGLGAIARGLGLAGTDTNQAKPNKNLEQAISGLQGASAEIKQASINNPLPGAAGRLERIAGTVATLKDGGNLNNLDTSAKEGIIRDTAKRAPEQMPTVKNIDPELVAKIIKETRPSEERQKQMGVFMSGEEMAKFSGHQYTDKDGGKKELLPLAAKIMAETKPSQMNAWGDDTARKAAASGIANQLWNGSQVSKAAELFGSKFVDIFKQNIKSPSFYAQNNKPMGAFIQSSPAKALGLEFQENNPVPTTKKRQAPPALAQKNPTSDDAATKVA